MNNKNPEDEEFIEETEDIALPEPELEDMEEAEEGKLKKLREKLKEAEEAKRQALEDLQRTKADFLNSKRRLEEQLARDRERITERHIEELLPLADSFEMAMRDPAWNEADPKWKKGVEGIHAQLMNIFRANGVEIINPLGQKFNPEEHEALTDEGNTDLVGTVIQSGYRMRNAIIRPAKVGIGTK